MARDMRDYKNYRYWQPIKYRATNPKDNSSYVEK